MSDNEVAVAQDRSGRSIYASDGSGWFRLVSHFPTSAEEAEVLYGESLGPKLQLEELQVLYDGAIKVIRI